MSLNKLSCVRIFSSQFHEENLRGALAKLRLYLNQLVLEHIPDTGCNVFPAIERLYYEEIGNVKNLSFKTDDGISHNESSRVGIEDLRSGEYHKGGTPGLSPMARVILWRSGWS